MGNAYIPRDRVHAWSEQIGDTPDQAVITRHLRKQRRLGRFIEENAALMLPATSSITTYMVAVICRMFENAGGRMRQATWAQIREASARVQGKLGEIVPTDEGMVDRARSVDRAQPHILDEALMALFQRVASDDEEQDMPHNELLKIYLMMWVATEVLDANWTPPPEFDGLTEYTYVHIEPKPPEDASDDG